MIGLDPATGQLADVSRRAARAPARGGLPNLLFAQATAQQPSEELTGRADEIRVALPWGDLLEGLALAEPAVLDGLAALARPGARLRLVLNGADWHAARAPRRMRRLPQLTPEHARLVLAPAYAAHGIQVTAARHLADGEIRALESTWARRLAHGRGGLGLTLVDACITPRVEATGEPGAPAQVAPDGRGGEVPPPEVDAPPAVVPSAVVPAAPSDAAASVAMAAAADVAAEVAASAEGPSPASR